MAKLKMLAVPRKPKRSASVATKEKFLARVNAIKKENLHRHSLNKKSENLDKVISGIGSVSVRPSGFKAINIRKRHASGRKKKAVAGVGSVKRKKRAHAAPKKAKRRRY